VAVEKISQRNSSSGSRVGITAVAVEKNYLEKLCSCGSRKEFTAVARENYMEKLRLSRKVDEFVQ